MKEDSVEQDYFWGVCPHCHRNDGYLNIGTDHWFICHTHRVKWVRGANLFSSWRYETETDWEHNQTRIAEYREIEPLWAPPSRETEHSSLCETCGTLHPPCKKCGQPTHCPPDEVGEPFIYCDDCDREME